jgi:PAS domain S-box-containing protein
MSRSSTYFHRKTVQHTREYIGARSTEDARGLPLDDGRGSVRAPSFPTRPKLAEERHPRPNDGDPTRASARGDGSDCIGSVPDLELQYDLAEILADAPSVHEMAPTLLQLLVGRLGLAAAELWIQVGDGPGVSPAGHWLVRDVHGSLPSSSSSEREPEPAWSPAGTNGHMTSPISDTPTPPADLFCSAEQSSPIDGKGRAILCTYSSAPRALDLATQRFLCSLGRQIARFIEARAQAERFEILAARQAVLLDVARDAAFTIDTRGRILTLNTTAEALFGLSSTAVGSDLVDLLVAPKQRKDVRAAIHYFRAARGRDARGRRLETCAVRSDHSEFAAVLSLARMDPSGVLPLTVLVSNVSRRIADERHLEVYQERLRSLTADLLLAEERARRELALDLHDGLSQTIALIKMRVAALRDGATSAQSDALDEVEVLIDQANRSARSVSFELSPPVLHDLGLEPALEWLAENIGARYGLHVVFEHDDRPKPTDEKTRIILFRSIRELLINAAKHAKAEVVTVSLERVGDELQVSVDDDGVGMALGLEEVEGFGLFSIQERLRHVGGDMSILSEPGRGTSVQLRAPADDLTRFVPPIDSPGPSIKSPALRTEIEARQASRNAGLGTSQGERT